MESYGTNRLSRTVSEILRLKYIGVMVLTFWGHVTLSVTWSRDSWYAVSYRWSFETIALSRIVVEILIMCETSLSQAYSYWKCINHHFCALRRIIGGCSISHEELYTPLILFGNAVIISSHCVSEPIFLFFFARDSIYAKRAYAIAIPSVRPSVRPSVCHTGGSVKNGWS